MFKLVLTFQVLMKLLFFVNLTRDQLTITLCNISKVFVVEVKASIIVDSGEEKISVLLQFQVPLNSPESVAVVNFSLDVNVRTGLERLSCFNCRLRAPTNQIKQRSPFILESLPNSGKKHSKTQQCWRWLSRNSRGREGQIGNILFTSSPKVRTQFA